MIPPDPLEGIGIVGFARALRAGRTSAEATADAYLRRIDALDDRLGAFETVAPNAALGAARAMDQMLACGIDLGPLMGVPVAIKDIVAVDGLPTRAGSNVDVSDLIGPEGGFVRMLKRAGCVILGKTKTVEFAMGGTGIGRSRGTPWNPCDPQVHRIPGGSSSGSGVATAAGLCGFAVGSDTGGSVRTPAAHCGVFGLKTTKGLWPTDGVFPLCPTLDTLGLLTRSAADAAVAFAALQGEAEPQPATVAGLRLGRPANHFFDHVDEEVAACVGRAIDAIRRAGANIVEIEIAEAARAWPELHAFVATELVAELGGRDGFESKRRDMDPDVAARTEPGRELSADAYARLRERHVAYRRIGDVRMKGLDGWITPTVPYSPRPVADFDDAALAERLVPVGSANTRIGNLFGLSAVSIPVHHLGSRLPAGMQILCGGGEDARVLAIACAIEAVIGTPPRPNLSGFL
ncbi:MAG: amidase [Rhodospirillales bacterium]|jgi:aspartyl-tRNA(Asn)/glutamyl-tRNA(Gln) amidotransferase subunit A|nr:amidase [Rhodospirillales bacterium]